jgi:hypothetical protein
MFEVDNRPLCYFDHLVCCHIVVFGPTHAIPEEYVVLCGGCLYCYPLLLEGLSERRIVLLLDMLSRIAVFLSLPGECVVLRLLILSTSTAEGFVREARPIVV